MNPMTHSLRSTALTILCLPVLTLSLLAQKPVSKDVEIPSDTTENAPSRAPIDPKATVAQNLDEAWTMLASAVRDKKSDLRMQGLAALGTLGANPRSETMISAAMEDKDLDVRVAAILAAGQTKSRNMTTILRTMLDDKDPQVAYAAAYTLWKMNDHSGEDILMAVIDGERSSNATMVNGTMHDVNKDLHHPGNLAKLGAMQAGYLMLGPFGYGLTAYNYMHRSGGNAARVSAIEWISEEKSAPIRNELLAALTDKDPTVRAAAAKALNSYHEKDVADAMLRLFTDSKMPVRLTAAATYILAATPGPAVSVATAHPKARKR